MTVGDWDPRVYSEHCGQIVLLPLFAYGQLYWSQISSQSSGQSLDRVQYFFRKLNKVFLYLIYVYKSLKFSFTLNSANLLYIWKYLVEMNRALYLWQGKNFTYRLSCTVEHSHLYEMYFGRLEGMWTSVMGHLSSVKSGLKRVINR